MSVSIRIPDRLHEEAKRAAAAEFRGVSDQIEYWAAVGKAALDNPDLPVEFVRDILMGLRQDPSELEPFHPGGA